VVAVKPSVCSVEDAEILAGMRAMFVLYAVFIFGAIAVYALVGLAHL
jgi:hypothetical protein